MARWVCVAIGLVVSILCVAAGIAILRVAPIVIHEITESNIVLSNRAIGYGFWKEPPFPILMQLWVWNLTNPEEVMTGAKPKIKDIGPFTYRETRPKTNITFDSENNTVSYISPQTYVLDRERSFADPKETYFTTINVPYITAVNEASFWGTIDQVGLQLVAKNTNATVFRSVRVYDFIWGYNDSFLEELKKLKSDSVPTTFFGIFAGRNNSHDGVYVVDTGKRNPSMTNVIQTYNGDRLLNFWSTEQSNMVNGTDGTYNPPYLDKNAPTYVFSPDICRSIKAEYEDLRELQGITAYRYIGPPSDFESAAVNSNNLGFCTPNSSHCLPGGLLNVSNCQQHAPVVMSLPHFLYTDPEVLDRIAEGLHPDKENHQTFFDIEPQTGAPLRINKRLQINVHVKTYKDFLDWKHLPDVYLPTVWLNESSCITEADGSEFRWLTLYPHLITLCVGWGLIGIGVIVLVVTITTYIVKKRKGPSTSRVLINEDTETITSRMADASVYSPTERSPLLSD